MSPPNDTTAERAATAVRALLAPTHDAAIRANGRALRPREQQRLNRLTRRAPDVVAQAKLAGADIRYLGIADLFSDHRVYRGSDTDWVLGPLAPDDPSVMPRNQRQTLRNLDAAGIHFPLLYCAHETPIAARTLANASPGVPLTTISRAEAAELAGPIPPPAGAVALADRLDHHAERMIAAARRGAPIAARAVLAALAAPIILPAAIIASLSLDPIIFGAIPAFRPDEGEPALFFELCHWSW